MDLPKAPEHDIRWAQITTECETNMKKWISEVINLVKEEKVTVAEAVNDLYDELTSLGYSEGYDSRCADEAGEGW